MRRFLGAIALATMMACLMSVSALAVPGTINYQGKLTDADDVPLNGIYIMRFYLYDAESGGNILWSEQQDVNVTNGIYDLQLGEITPFPAGLFDNESLYLEVEIFSTNTGWETLSPCQRISSSAYAMKAGDAEKLGGQPPAYYAVATKVQERVTGTCPPGSSIREIKSNGSVICETDDVNDAVSNSSGTYNNMRVGYANSAGNADTLDGYHSSAFALSGHTHRSSARFSVPQDTLRNYHPDCTISTTSFYKTVMACTAACTRYCQGYLGYIGGTANEWDGVNYTVQCLCTP